MLCHVILLPDGSISFEVSGNVANPNWTPVGHIIAAYEIHAAREDITGYELKVEKCQTVNSECSCTGLVDHAHKTIDRWPDIHCVQCGL